MFKFRRENIFKEDKMKKNTVEKQQKCKGGITGKGFMPGVSGNPGGKKKGTVGIPAMLRRIGTEKAPAKIAIAVQELFGLKKGESLTMFECFMRLTYVSAIEGNPKAMDFIADRTEGKVSQQIVMEHRQRVKIDGENPMEYLKEYLNSRAEA